MPDVCVANMEAPVVQFDGRPFRWIGGCAYRDGERVIKLPAMYPFSEYRLLQLFHELAPQYSPGPVSAVTVNGRNGVLMRFAGDVALVGEDSLERVMGFLQSIHCLLLVSSHLAMRGLRARQLRRRGEGEGVEFRLVHVGAWLKSGASWQNNCTEIERLWKDVGWANVQPADRTDPEIVSEMVARAGAAVGRYASEFSGVPPAMGELRCAIEETAGKRSLVAASPGSWHWRRCEVLKRELESAREKCAELNVQLCDSERRLSLASEICRVQALDDDEFGQYLKTERGGLLAGVVADCGDPREGKKRLLQAVVDGVLPTLECSR